MCPKRLLGTVHKDPHVLPVDSQVFANLVLVPLLHEHGAKNLAVAIPELRQNFVHDRARLARHGIPQSIGSLVQKARSHVVFQGIGSRTRAIVLEQHVVANRVDQGAEPLTMPDASVIPQQREHARECLLPDILNGVVGPQSRAQLEGDQLTEVAHKVLFGRGVTATQPFHVGVVERLEIQSAYSGVAACPESTPRGSSSSLETCLRSRSTLKGPPDGRPFGISGMRAPGAGQRRE